MMQEERGKWDSMKNISKMSDSELIGCLRSPMRATLGPGANYELLFAETLARLLDRGGHGDSWT